MDSVTHYCTGLCDTVRIVVDSVHIVRIVVDSVSTIRIVVDSVTTVLIVVACTDSECAAQVDLCKSGPNCPLVSDRPQPVVRAILGASYDHRQAYQNTRHKLL